MVERHGATTAPTEDKSNIGPKRIYYRKFTKLWTFLIVMANVVAIECQYTPTNPCPNMFRYIQDIHTPGGWKGIVDVQLPRPAPILNVSVMIWYTDFVHQTYPGGLQLGEDKNYLWKRFSSGAGGRAKYEVLFPETNPLPYLTEIVVNNVVVCQGTRVEAQQIRYFTYSRYITGIGETDYNPPYVPVQPDTEISPISVPWIVQPPENVQGPSWTHYVTDTTRTSTTTTTTTKPTTPRPNTALGTPPGNKRNICGVPIAYVPLVVNGGPSKEGEWPWIAALFRTDEIAKYSYFCSGSLINTRYVVTAAHCFRTEATKSLTEINYIVYLGIYDITRVTHPNVQTRKVDRIMTHREFGIEKDFDADISVLKLSRPVEYTNFVRPICLWRSQQSISYFRGKRGAVISWGKDENGDPLTRKPRKIDLPIVPKGECDLTHVVFEALSSSRSFCAGDRDNSGPCTGDSGSGFFVSVNEGNIDRWYLLGITSHTIKHEDTCNLRNYAVFTDVTQFSSWIEEFQD